jgi:hypothetical protein
MHTVAARGPSENARRISGDGLKVIGIQPSSQTLVRYTVPIYLCSQRRLISIKAAFGVTISSKMLSVHARLLPVPSVMYHNASFTPKLAEWNLQQRFFVRHVPIDKWSYLTFGKKITDEVWAFFQGALKACGMGEIDPDPYDGFHANVSEHSDNDTNDRAIQNAMSIAKKKGVRILWVVLPSNFAPLYARVKFCADVQYGMLNGE